MKNKKFWFIGVFLLVFSLGFFSFNRVARAANIKEAKENQLTVTIDEDVEDDLYVTGQNVVINADIKGDLYVAGQNVDINGNVEGKVFSAAQVIDINGDIGKNVMIVSQTLNINGSVKRNLFFSAAFVNLKGEIGEDIFGVAATIDMDSKVSEDVYLAAGEVSVRKEIEEDAFIGAGSVELKSDIGGDVFIGTDKLQSERIKVGGDFTLTSARKRDIPENITVEGKKTFNLSEEIKLSEEKVDVKSVRILAPMSVFGFTWRIFKDIVNMFGYILLGILALQFMPVKIKNSVNKLRSGEDIFKSLGIGFVSIPVGLIVSVALIIAVPVLKVVLALATIAWNLALPISAMMVGEKLFELTIKDSERNYLKSLVLGVVVIQLVGLIPVLGGLTKLVFILMGVGAMLRMQWSKYKMSR